MKQPVWQKKKLANHFAKQPCSLLPHGCFPPALLLSHDDAWL